MKMRIEKKMSRFNHRMLKVLTGGGLFVSLACLAWLLLRSGRKPDRLRYPCQQFAAAQSGMLFAGGVAPLVLPAPLAWGMKSRRATIPHRGEVVRTALAAFLCLALLLTFAAFGGGGGSSPSSLPSATTDRMAAAASALSIQPQQAAAGDASDIFVAQGISEDKADQAAASLVAIMAGAGTHFYRSSQARPDCGPDGLIAPDDVVVIKVNAEWRERGMTNTDVIKGLIGAVVDHPDGFTGEIVICENGQWQDPAFMDSPDRNNAYDRGQSYADVAAAYAGTHRVSTYDWTLVRKSAVGEFDAGDYADGYVPVDAVAINYPKFTSAYGTAISMRNGIWNGSVYDNARLKLLNVPVLKSHHYTGVTAACKLFMGFWSTALLGYDPHANMVFNGYMGRIMAYGRYPDLNIIDAVWCNPDYLQGPNAPYGSAAQSAVVLASRDPIALDYFAGKHVLYQVSGYGRHDPDNPDSSNPGNGKTYADGTPCYGGPYNAFNQMLTSTAAVLSGAGYVVTRDEAKMNVYTQEALKLDSVSPGLGPVGTSLGLTLEGAGFQAGAAVRLERSGEAPIPAAGVSAEGSRRLRGEVDLTSTAPGAWDVVVENPDHATARLTAAFTVYVANTDAYFAEGYTGPGFQEYICLANPEASPALVNITYMFPDGGTLDSGLVVPARSRSTVDVNAAVGADREVAARVMSDRAVICERPMYFRYQDRLTGGSDVMAAGQPAADWYFAEGYTGPGFDTWVCVLNPGDQPAHLTFRFQTQEVGEIVKDGLVVGPRSRRTFKANDLLGPDYQFSLKLTSDRPVVAERPVYFNYSGMAGRAWDGGHCVMGANATGRELYFAEGTTRSDFEEWLTLQNPNAASIEVKAEYHFAPDQGAAITRTYRVAAGSRATLFVPAEAGADKDVSIKLSSAADFLAERPMYFDYQGYGAAWDGGHCVIGATAPAAEWVFAEGYTGDGFQEWLCLQNPADADATVEITYLTQEQGALSTRTHVIPAGSRVSIRVNDDAGADFQLSCYVRVVSGPPVVVERPMYFDFRGCTGGHDSLGATP